MFNNKLVRDLRFIFLTEVLGKKHFQAIMMQSYIIS